MAREIIERQPYLGGFLGLLGEEGTPSQILATLTSLLESGDFDAFHAHLLASIPPSTDRRSTQIIAALETNLFNGRIFAARGESPKYSFQQALNCFRALSDLS